MGIYRKTDTDCLAKLLQGVSGVGYFDVSYSDLGGEDRASIIVRATSEKKEDWAYGILHNARFAMFRLSHDGKIELFARHSHCPKFRKCRAKSLQDAAQKIANYFQSF